jgi:hypothetical protein
MTSLTDYLTRNVTRTSIPRFARTSRNGASTYTSRNGPIDSDMMRAIAPSIFAEDAMEAAPANTHTFPQAPSWIDCKPRASNPMQ